MTGGRRADGRPDGAPDGEAPRSGADEDGRGPVDRAPAGQDDEPADPEQPMNPA